MSEQVKFWDDETNQDKYVEQFLLCAKKNKWIDMLIKAEGAAGVLVEGRILEIGGGSQFLSRFIAENRTSEVICTDISTDRINTFQSYYGDKKNLKISGGINAEKLPYKDQEFDYIVGDAVLHHIEDLRSALLEIRRCLKDNGAAIFIREPTLGIYLPFRRKVKELFQHSSYKEYLGNYIKDNRYEYCRYPLQWNEEFLRAGLQSRRLPGWYYWRWKDRLFSTIPNLFPSLSVYVLRKNKYDN